MPETNDISILTSILHQNGDRVLNALSKLSLNAVLLQKINKEFELFLEKDSGNAINTFHVLATGNTNSQMLQDLHFLHDFMQKTIGLKLTNNCNISLLDDKVDISKFKSIKYLEIQKVPVKEIIGFTMIQSQLECIVCIKCMSKLEELLANCGGDKSIGFVWSELREAVISYNNIKVLDTSIAFAPWLQVLDLSHNQIVDVKAIECLPNLKYVNLSFNCLSEPPSFSKSARKRMLVLLLKNNYIEDLSGLAGLDHLTELDVSWNWISHYECLQPLLTMSTLQSLFLKGNPICYHRYYKRNVIGYLHISASFINFVLDGSRLSKYEKSIVGYRLCQPSRSASSSPIESVTYGLPSTQSLSDVCVTDKGSNSKKGRVRLAVIPNLDDGTYEEIPANVNTINFKEAPFKEHLITKKKIEDARATYGSDNWLRCEAGSVVQDILGLPPNEPMTLTPLDEYYLNASSLKNEDDKITTQVVIEYNLETDTSDKNNADSRVTCIDSSEYFSVEGIPKLEENAKEKCQDHALKCEETWPDIETIQETREEIEDENENLYLVSKIINERKKGHVVEDIFLSLTDVELKEKDLNRGHVMNKWSISSLESCVKLQANKLQLNFDSIKRDKRERIYEMEEKECYSLYKALTEILEGRTLEDMNQIAYTCVNCLSQFSKINNPRKREYSFCCPFCNSKLIFESGDHSPSQDRKNVNAKSNITKISEITSDRNPCSGELQGLVVQMNKEVLKYSSQSSVDSVDSPSTEIQKRSFPSDEFRDASAVQNMNVKRSDSDIEILSNPSQSSIEVIDGTSRIHGGNTPRRKRSSEERQQIHPVTSLSEKVTPINYVGGLTESSSSGSITDSICTAYENNIGTRSLISKMYGVSFELEDTEKIINRDGNGLPLPLPTAVKDDNENQSSKIYSKTKRREKTIDQVQYSYADFTKIDHRIKLMLYSQIFQESNEEFSFIVRCTVLPANASSSVESCVVSSNKRLYILKVTGPEGGDDASNFLEKKSLVSFNLKLLKSIQTLAWYQGLSIKLDNTNEKSKEILILFMDKKRTQNFVKFLLSSDTNIPKSCRIIGECPQKPALAIQHLLVSGASEDSNIHYFNLLRDSIVYILFDMNEVKSGAILTNSTDLLLFSSKPTWLGDEAEPPPQPAFSQKLCNLMSIEIYDFCIRLMFRDKLEKKDEVWHLRMTTTEAMDELVGALKSPWEEMFSVELQVSALQKCSE